MAGGRPLKFESVKELQLKIDAYFDECDPHPELKVSYEYSQITVTKKRKDGTEYESLEDDRSVKPTSKEEWVVSYQKHYTITGLANFLNTSRETLINYEKRDEFFDTIKAAKDRVEEQWENLLIGSNATGPIFNLKNNYGWRDKTEQEISNPDGSLNPYNALTAEELRKLADR